MNQQDVKKLIPGKTWLKSAVVGDTHLLTYNYLEKEEKVLFVGLSESGGIRWRPNKNSLYERTYRPHPTRNEWVQSPPSSMEIIEQPKPNKVLAFLTS